MSKLFQFRARLVAGLMSLLLMTVVPAKAEPESVETWVGTIETPAGELRLILSVSDNGQGEQGATLESIDQAPGQFIPISSVAIDNERLVFRSDRIGASYEGQWDADEEAFIGVFRQGRVFPLELSRAPRPQLPTFTALEGMWEGELARGDSTLGLQLNIVGTPNGTVATLDSLDEGVSGLRVVGLAYEENLVRFRIPSANVEFSGSLDVGTGRLVGDWHRPGFEKANISFDRTESMDLGRKRPQEPAEPFPYKSQDVSFGNPTDPDVILHGTLTLPNGEGPFPGVVLLTGSGPQDRNHSVFEHKPFLVISDILTRRGIAVLRYDDRGFGESSGNFARSDLDDFASDARAAWHFLSKQPAVRADAVGLLGHSEGALIAPIVASEELDVAFLVLLASPGVQGDALFRNQARDALREAGRTEDEIAEAMVLLRELHRNLTMATDRMDAASYLDQRLTNKDLELLGAPADMRATVIRQFSREWYRSMLTHDPIVFLKDLNLPVLAMHGSLDSQVDLEENFRPVADVLEPNSKGTTIELPFANHLFQEAENGKIAEYAEIEQTFSPDVLDIISEWIDWQWSLH